MKEYVEDIKTHGFTIVPDLIDSETVFWLQAELTGVTSSEAVSQGRENSFSIRNLLNIVPAIRVLAKQDALMSVVEPILGKEARVVRGTFFDKTPEANWKVPWHQDLTIAVRQRFDVDGFGPWSVKAGIIHVQPPISVLENILAVRLHLDNTDESNGALKVIPGSHTQGRASIEETQRWKQTGRAVACPVPRGGVLAMRPLLLHASSTSHNPSHRRVVHLEFSSSQLPEGLEWHGS